MDMIFYTKKICYLYSVKFEETKRRRFVCRALQWQHDITTINLMKKRVFAIFACHTI